MHRCKGTCSSDNAAWAKVPHWECGDLQFAATPVMDSGTVRVWKQQWYLYNIPTPVDGGGQQMHFWAAILCCHSCWISQ